MRTNTYKIEVIIRFPDGHKDFREFFIENMRSSCEAVLKCFEDCPQSHINKFDIVRISIVD